MYILYTTYALFLLFENLDNFFSDDTFSSQKAKSQLSQSNSFTNKSIDLLGVDDDDNNRDTDAEITLPINVTLVSFSISCDRYL